MMDNGVLVSYWRLGMYPKRNWWLRRSIHTLSPSADGSLPVRARSPILFKTTLSPARLHAVAATFFEGVRRRSLLGCHRCLLLGGRV